MATRNSTDVPSRARRALLTMLPWLAGAAAVPMATSAIAAKGPTPLVPAAGASAQEARSCVVSAPECPAARAHDYSVMWPGRDPDPIPVGTRCLYNYGMGEFREVVIAAGPINPEPGNWEEPVGWYMVEGPWIEESYARMDAQARERIVKNNHRMARLRAFMQRTDEVARKREARSLISKLSSRNVTEQRMIGQHPAFATHRRSLTIIARPA